MIREISTEKKRMEYSRITAAQIDVLWDLQKAYKAEIKEELPADSDRERLAAAIAEDRIRFSVRGTEPSWRMLLDYNRFFNLQLCRKRCL